MAIGGIAIAVGLFPVLSTCAVAEEDQWRVNFQKGSQKVESSAVALLSADGPVLVSIALQGADFSAASLILEGKSVAAKFAGYDAVSRLCFFKPTQPVSDPVDPWLEQAPLQNGAAVMIGGRTGTLKGKVHRIGGKILPLALLRIHSAGSSPTPGSAVSAADGKVIGIVFQAGEEANEVYAIPAEAVHRVARDVISSGRLVRGWLGVSLRVENTEPRITKVWAGSPAEGGGLREGDVITRIGSRDVGGYDDVVDAFFYLVPEKSVELSVVRDGKTFRFALMPTGDRPN